MKKSLVALAALAATGAFAQSSVTLYGVADAYVGTHKHNGVSQTVVNSGGLSGSRVGVSVKEDLGAGLAGFAVLEAGADISNPAGTVGARKSVLGLSGSFGAVSFGRQDTPFFEAVDGLADAQGTDEFSALVGSNQAGIGVHSIQTTKFNNSIRYDTPNFDGFAGSVHLGLGENKAGNARADRDTAFNVRYVNGPLGVGLAHQIDESGNNTARRTDTAVAGFYDFGAAKLNLGLTTAKLKNVSGNDKGFNIGVTAPIGAFTVIGQVAKYKASGNFATVAPYTVSIGGNKNRTSIGLEGRYALSKRTTSYVGFNQTKNDNKPTDKTSRLFGVGVRHVF